MHDEIPSYCFNYIHPYAHLPITILVAPLIVTTAVKIKSLFHQVPDLVAFFPLNGTYGTKEIKGGVHRGIPSGVILANGPHDQNDGSYQFSGTSNSYIEFSNTEGGNLDVRNSMTILCWLKYEGQNGPIFTYKVSGGVSWGVHFWVASGKLFVRFKQRDYTEVPFLKAAILGNNWRFVGASYNQTSGEAKLWVDGLAIHTLNIGAGLELATQDSVRMGAVIGDNRYLKGRITQMQIYNEDLTQEQVQKIQSQVAGKNVMHLQKQSIPSTKL